MSQCQLCNASESVEKYTVEPRNDTITICSVCLSGIDEPLLNEKHWNCLHDSMWSDVPAVQVMAFRLLTKLGSRDQLDMLYLEDDVKKWAEEGLEDANIEATRDSNGNILSEGDSVSIIKDLLVKGAGFTAKQGTTVKNIRIVPGDPTHIQGKVNSSTIFILSKFLKKLQ